MVPDFKTTLGLPQDAEGPVFGAPWEAAAFSIAVKLCEDGHFTWPDWVACYSEGIRKAEETDQHVHYYEVWLASLERMIVQRGLLNPASIDDRHTHLRHHPPHHAHEANRKPVCVA